MERPASRARAAESFFFCEKKGVRAVCARPRAAAHPPPPQRRRRSHLRHPLFTRPVRARAPAAQSSAVILRPPFRRPPGGPRGPVPRTYAYGLKNGETAASVARPPVVLGGPRPESPTGRGVLWGGAENLRPAEKRAGRHGATDRRGGRHGRAPSAPASTSRGREDSPL